PAPALTPLSLHDALPILQVAVRIAHDDKRRAEIALGLGGAAVDVDIEKRGLVLGVADGRCGPVAGPVAGRKRGETAFDSRRRLEDRKSTRLNSSHGNSSY